MANPIVEKVQEAKKIRPVFVYDVPEKMAAATGTKSIGVVQLSSRDELTAAKRANGDSNRLAFELALQSLAEVDGQAVSLTDGTADKAFNEMDPLIRNLLLNAYAQLHAPPEDVTNAFLASRRVKVG